MLFYYMGYYAVYTLQCLFSFPTEHHTSSVNANLKINAFTYTHNAS